MIDKNKKYRTRDGKEVIIYSTEGIGTYCVHGAVKTSSGLEISMWSKNGIFNIDKSPDNPDDDMDLVEVKPRIKRERWVNIYDSCEVFFNTKQDCDAADDDYKKCIPGGPGRIACVKVVIDCEQGEGL